MDRESTDLPQENITPLIGKTPRKPKIFWPPQKTQNSKISITPPNLGRGCTPWSCTIHMKDPIKQAEIWANMSKYDHEIALLPFLDAFISWNISELNLLHTYGLCKRVLIFIYSGVSQGSDSIFSNDLLIWKK